MVVKNIFPQQASHKLAPTMPAVVYQNYLWHTGCVTTKLIISVQSTHNTE